jgi:hypothetical protein
LITVDRLTFAGDRMDAIEIGAVLLGVLFVVGTSGRALAASQELATTSSSSVIYGCEGVEDVFEVCTQQWPFCA